MFIIKPWYSLNEDDPTNIYGVSWNGTSTTQWTRTDSAIRFINPVPYYLNMSGSPRSPFDRIMPWSGMVRVTDSTVGELVAIPKFYYKMDYANPEASVKGLKIQISMTQHEGFLCSPAHMNRGDGTGERDVVYIGRYHCSGANNSKYKSVTGVSPANQATRATFRSGIHNLGANIWQLDYAMLVTIWLLYLVEFADWNSQAVIGYGTGNGSSVSTMGYTDNMPYHTGTTLSSKTTYGIGTQYRNIEGLWDNVLDWCDGIYFNGTSIYIIKNPSSFSDSSNGTFIGYRPSAQGWTTSWAIPTTSGYEYAIYPNNVSTLETGNTYICDSYGITSTGTVLRVGGNYINYQAIGLFNFSGDYAASGTNAVIGSRLMKLP